MALPLAISASAKADLLEIWAWVAEDSPAAADRMLDRLYEVAGNLGELPKMGRPREELGEGLRSFVVGSHVVFYRARPDRLELVRVLHGRRDVDAQF